MFRVALFRTCLAMKSEVPNEYRSDESIVGLLKDLMLRSVLASGKLTVKNLPTCFAMYI